MWVFHLVYINIKTIYINTFIYIRLFTYTFIYINIKTISINTFIQRKSSI